MVLQFLLLHPSFSRQQLFSSSHNCRAFKLYERLDQIELMIKKEGMESTVDTTYKVGLSSTHFSATTAEVESLLVYFMLIMICCGLVANSSYLYNRISRLLVAPLQSRELGERREEPMNFK